MFSTAHYELGNILPTNIVESQDLLEDSLNTLRDVPNEAREEGLPIPSETAIGNAKAAIKKLHSIFPSKYTACSDENGEVIITVPIKRFGCAMSLQCDSDGGLTCYVNTPVGMRRMKDYDADLAFESSNFIFKAIEELENLADARHS